MSKARDKWSYDRQAEFRTGNEEYDNAEIVRIQKAVRELNKRLENKGCKITQFNEGRPKYIGGINGAAVSDHRI